MFKIFICFHKKIHERLYKELTPENAAHLVLYGVNETISKAPIESIYEKYLDHYVSSLQKKLYNEGSCLYHVYQNNLYKNLSYVGFGQYDMCFSNKVLGEINEIITNNPSMNIVFAGQFAIESYKKPILQGSLKFITRGLKYFKSGLDNYNFFFDTKYTLEDIIDIPFIMCNTFIIPVKMYKKYMEWTMQFYGNPIPLSELHAIYFEDSGMHLSTIPNPEKIFNPGHLIEAMTAMFLAIQILEKAILYPISVEHDPSYKI
jgi:hypothetical protein